MAMPAVLNAAHTLFIIHHQGGQRPLVSHSVCFPEGLQTPEYQKRSLNTVYCPNWFLFIQSPWVVTPPPPSSRSCCVPPLPWPHAAGHSPCPENTGLAYIRKAGQTCVFSNGDYVVALPCLGPALWLGDLWLSKKPTPAARGESNFLFDIRILRVNRQQSSCKPLNWVCREEAEDWTRYY